MRLGEEKMPITHLRHDAKKTQKTWLGYGKMPAASMRCFAAEKVVS